MSGGSPVVAVVGRPNVGKSTLFNRVVGRRVAIVDDTPGVTRDRNFARTDWAGRAFFIVDTGGIVDGSDEPLDRAVQNQAMTAVGEADVIVFIVDGKGGPHPLDQKLAEVLRASGRPTLLVVNKLDRLPEELGHHDFWGLGLGTPIPVSSMSGRGSGDLLDSIVRSLPESPEYVPAPDEIRVAVVGKPNVGKSSFVNRLLGADRVVVNAEPGTTRDPVDTPMRYHGHGLIFVDTAGLRRQSRVSDRLEYYSALRTHRVIERADICLVLVDAAEGMALQDLKIAELGWRSGAGVILLVNKWDLIQKDHRTAPQYERGLRERAPFLQWTPMLFISVLTGLRVRKTLDLILQVQEERHRRIETHEVNLALRELVARQPPPHARGREVKLRYGTQVTVAPPTFVLFSNLPRDVPDHYMRYVRNSFRRRWGFEGSPLRLRLKESVS